MRNHTNRPMSSTLGRIALTLFMFVSICSLSSCHKDDDTITPDVKQLLVGKWTGSLGYLLEWDDGLDPDPNAPVIHFYNTHRLDLTFYEDGTYKIDYIDEKREEKGKWEIKEETQLYLSKFHESNVEFTINGNTLEFKSKRTIGSLTRVK